MAGVSDGAHRAPAPGLRRYLESYEGYRLAGFEPGVHVGMPSPYLTVIITIGDAPIELSAMSRPEQAPGCWTALASGITMRPCTIAHDGNQHGIQLSLTPLGARALLGVPTAELGSWVVSLDDVLGADARELRDRIDAPISWDERFDVLDEVFTRRVAALRPDRADPIDGSLTRAWRMLVGGGGRAKVAEVAAEVGWSRRHLISRFQAEFGVSPKDSARIARFTESHARLRAAQMPPLAQVAAECGYYDQAHMARDWREFAGMSPSRWRADEKFAFVQEPTAPVRLGC
ncbi:MAG TPA: helix-turn-helix domain-containing protein [Aldersonia sp.]